MKKMRKKNTFNFVLTFTFLSILSCVCVTGSPAHVTVIDPPRLLLCTAVSRNCEKCRSPSAQLPARHVDGSLSDQQGCVSESVAA